MKPVTITFYVKLGDKSGSEKVSRTKTKTHTVDNGSPTVCSQRMQI